MHRSWRSGEKEEEMDFYGISVGREGGARSPKLEEAAGPCEGCLLWIPTGAPRLKPLVFKTSSPVLTNWVPHEHHPKRLYPISVLQSYYF